MNIFANISHSAEGVYGFRVWRFGFGWYSQFAGVGMIAAFRGRRAFNLRIWRAVFAFRLWKEQEDIEVYFHWPSYFVIE